MEIRAWNCVWGHAQRFGYMASDPGVGEQGWNSSSQNIVTRVDNLSLEMNLFVEHSCNKFTFSTFFGASPSVFPLKDGLDWDGLRNLLILACIAELKVAPVLCQSASGMKSRYGLSSKKKKRMSWSKCIEIKYESREIALQTKKEPSFAAGRCSSTLAFPARWEVKGQSALGQAAISPKLLLDVLKERFHPPARVIWFSHQQRAALVTDAEHQKWNTSCCHTAVCLRGHSTGRLLQCSSLGFPPVGSQRTAGVSGGCLTSAQLAVCLGIPQKGRKCPPKASYTLGRAETQLPAWPRASWDQPSLWFSAESHGKRERRDLSLEIQVLQMPFLHSTLHLC